MVKVEFRTSLGHKGTIETTKFMLDMTVINLRDRGCYGFVIV